MTRRSIQFPLRSLGMRLSPPTLMLCSTANALNENILLVKRVLTSVADQDVIFQRRNQFGGQSSQRIQFEHFSRRMALRSMHRYRYSITAASGSKPHTREAFAARWRNRTRVV